MKNIFYIVIALTLTLVSCKKEENNPNGEPTTPTETLSLISTVNNGNNDAVSLYAQSSTLQTGYNKLYVSVKNSSGALIENASISFNPIMDMGSMTHSSPVEQPTFNTSTKKYEGVVVFTMPSSQGTWTLNVDVNGSIASFVVTIVDAPTKVVGSYTGSDSQKYILTLVPKASWTVGMNDVEIMIHKKIDSFTFVAETDMDIVMTPEMISMGHGSPNNISPVHIGNGHYNGDLNLTMTGDWRLNFDLSKNSTSIYTGAFVDILF